MQRPHALAIPVEAVPPGGKSVLMVNGSHQVEERPVTLGLETATHYEVLSGPQEGDLVMIGNPAQLHRRTARSSRASARSPAQQEPASEHPLLLTDEQLQALRRLDACTVANAIETFQLRLRNEGFVDHTVRSLFPELASDGGVCRDGEDPRLGAAGGRDAVPGPHATGGTTSRQLPSPRVVVVQDTATRPGLCSLVGEVHMNILRALHCVGVVTNGSVRDIPAARSAGFHYFAGSVAVSHGYVHIVDFGKPVKSAG